jgi:hypothetical protein
LIASDPAVLREALMHQLFSYLHFTDRLEHEVVNNVVRKIAVGFPGLPVPEETRLDAYKIYCDEAYHSLFSADFMFQLAAESGFQFDAGAGHPALDYFHSATMAAGPEAREWFALFFVACSETLLSGSLVRIPQAENVIPAVREMVADHAEDEFRHHAFFARLCKNGWPQMPRSLQVRIGCALPCFILRFLSPDYPSIQAFLRRRFSARQTSAILEESYPPEALLADAHAASRPTVRVFRDAGAFELPEVAESFTAAGLPWNSRSAAAR